MLKVLFFIFRKPARSKKKSHLRAHAQFPFCSEGHYDSYTINKIPDAQVICNIGFVADGRPIVVPTLYGRDGNRVLFHGSSLSRMLKATDQSPEICLTVSILDGFVLARSAFHHSANYRSVMLFGKAEKIEEKSEKLEALRLISEHLLPGRWEEARKPSPGELKATLVMALEISEGAAKIRSGGPKDDPRDMDLAIWAGVLPVKTILLDPEPSADLRNVLPLPPSVNLLKSHPLFHQNSSESKS